MVEGLSDSLTADPHNKQSWPERKKAYIRRLRKEHADVRLISVADKLYNARAILEDYRQIGPRVWERFKRGGSSLAESPQGQRFEMPKRSAGLLMYRRSKGHLEVFLIHPGGPYFAKKDKGAWAIPKGEYEKNEDPLIAAKREFEEETGFTAAGDFLDLGSIKQRSGKIVTVAAFEGDCDPADLVSNTCLIEWPPHSGRSIEIPEVDQGRWFGMTEAREYIRKDQEELLDRLREAFR
jgi:predicted NUDIX family NTP pyrophosphohydrolase